VHALGLAVRVEKKNTGYLIVGCLTHGRFNDKIRRQCARGEGGVTMVKP
jgi:hypothetical protein